MPNWVKTNVYFKCNDEDFNEIIKKYRDNERDFSFSKVFPAPDNIYQGSLGQAEREKYGDNNWYTWNCKNWGTKWDCSESWHNQFEHMFSWETAWDCAYNLLVKLSQQLPNIEIKVSYADEDLGSNCGAFKLVDGEEIEGYYPDDDKESFAFACYVWDYESPSVAWYSEDDEECPISYDHYWDKFTYWNGAY